MNFDMESLGFTKEELQERVIERICEQLLSSVEYDPEDGGEYPIASKFKNAIDERIKKQVNDTINKIAETSILPNVSEYIENLTIQETNGYGEKRGTSATFIEYLTGRAKAYMQEEVDYQGKTKAENNSYSFTGKQTRITYLIHQHLHYSIETAMKDSLKVATGEIAKGIHETARHKLNEIAESLKVTVATK